MTIADIKEVLDNAPEPPASDGGDEDEGQEDADGIEDFDNSGVDEEDNDEGDEEADGEPEFEEIEFAGKRYSVPKDLKDGFMMQADYTRKTQGLAAERKALEERQQAFEKEQEARKETAVDRANLQNMQDAIKQYENVDWATYQQQDLNAANAYWRQYQVLQGQEKQLAQKIETTEKERASAAEREHATRVKETHEVLARDIPGWGGELIQKLTAFGRAQGYSQQELMALNTDARGVKVLHGAYVADQLTNRAKDKQRKGKKASAAKPLEQVSRKRTARPPADARPSDRDSDDAWMRKRNAEVHKRQRMG